MALLNIMDQTENTKMSVKLDYIDARQTGGLAGVTKHKSGWILQRNIDSMPPSGYAILDEYRKPVFTISGTLNDARSGIVFTDPKGGRVAYLKKTPTMAKPRTWTLFSFEPFYTGQRSVGKVLLKDDTSVKAPLPLYQYALIDSSFQSHMGEFGYYRFLPRKTEIFPSIIRKKKDIWFARVRSDIGFKLDVRNMRREEGIAQIGQDAFFALHPATE